MAWLSIIACTMLLGAKRDLRFWPLLRSFQRAILTRPLSWLHTRPAMSVRLRRSGAALPREALASQRPSPLVNFFRHGGALQSANPFVFDVPMNAFTRFSNFSHRLLGRVSNGARSVAALQRHKRAKLPLARSHVILSTRCRSEMCRWFPRASSGPFRRSRKLLRSALP